MVTSHICWNCKNKVDPKNLFCSKCNKIQLPKTLNEFELLGIEEIYNLNLEFLENRYLKLQKMVHPDKFSNLSDKEIKYSTLLSSMINDAYQKLENKNSRANLILTLRGFTKESESKSYNDPEVLEEIMNIQNRCLETDSLQSKKEILKELDYKISNTSKGISESFDIEDYKNAYKLNIKLSYLEKIKNNLKML